MRRCNRIAAKGAYGSRGSVMTSTTRYGTTLSSMVWTDAVFKTLTSFALGNDDNALNNPLMMEALLNGHVATQVLAIRRLMDNGGSDIISLRRLVKDLQSNFHLFTREN